MEEIMERLRKRLADRRTLSQMDRGYAFTVAPTGHHTPERTGEKHSRERIFFGDGRKYAIQPYYASRVNHPKCMETMINALYEQKLHCVGPMSRDTVHKLQSARILCLPARNFTVGVGGTNPHDFFPSTTPTRFKSYSFTYRLLSPNVEAVYYCEDGFEYLAGLTYYNTRTMRRVSGRVADADAVAIRREFAMTDYYPLRDRILYQGVSDDVFYGRNCEKARGRRVLVKKTYARELYDHIDHCYSTGKETVTRCKECRNEAQSYDFMVLLKQRQAHRLEHAGHLKKMPHWARRAEGVVEEPGDVFRPKFLFVDVNPCATDVPDPEREAHLKDARVVRSGTSLKVDCWWAFLKETEQMLFHNGEPTIEKSEKDQKYQNDFVEALRVIERRRNYVSPNDTQDVYFEALNTASDILERNLCKLYSRRILSIEYDAKGSSEFHQLIDIVKKKTVMNGISRRSDSEAFVAGRRTSGERLELQHGKEKRAHTSEIRFPPRKPTKTKRIGSKKSDEKPW